MTYDVPCHHQVVPLSLIYVSIIYAHQMATSLMLNVTTRWVCDHCCTWSPGGLPMIIVTIDPPPGDPTTIIVTRYRQQLFMILINPESFKYFKFFPAMTLTYIVSDLDRFM